MNESVRLTKATEGFAVGNIGQDKVDCFQLWSITAYCQRKCAAHKYIKQRAPNNAFRTEWHWAQHTTLIIEKRGSLYCSTDQDLLGLSTVGSTHSNDWNIEHKPLGCQTFGSQLNLNPQ